MRVIMLSMLCLSFVACSGMGGKITSKREVAQAAKGRVPIMDTRVVNGHISADEQTRKSLILMDTAAYPFRNIKVKTKIVCAKDMGFQDEWCALTPCDGDDLKRTVHLELGYTTTIEPGEKVLVFCNQGSHRRIKK